MYAGGPIAWSSRKQSCVALSTTEAEIVAASSCVQEAIWFSSILKEFGISSLKPIVIHEDNQGAITLAQTSVNWKRTKHIDLRYSFINDATGRAKLFYRRLERRKILLTFLPSPWHAIVLGSLLVSLFLCDSLLFLCDSLSLIFFVIFSSQSHSIWRHLSSWSRLSYWDFYALDD